MCVSTLRPIQGIPSNAYRQQAAVEPFRNLTSHNPAAAAAAAAEVLYQVAVTNASDLNVAKV